MKANYPANSAMPFSFGREVTAMVLLGSRLLSSSVT